MSDQSTPRDNASAKRRPTPKPEGTLTVRHDGEMVGREWDWLAKKLLAAPLEEAKQDEEGER